MPTPSDTHHQGRVVAGTEEAVLVTADATLTGWGSGPSAAFASGSKDHRGRCSVTCGTTPGANPTVAVAFKRAFASAPFVAPARGDAVAPAGGYWAITTRSATGFTATFVGTPQAASVYVLDWEAQE